MGLQIKTSDQIVTLSPCYQGQWLTIAITSLPGAAGNATLEFQNAGDDVNWHTHPDFTGTPTGGVIVQRVRCLSARMRLSFAGAPGADFWVALIYEVVPEY